MKKMMKILICIVLVSQLFGCESSPTNLKKVITLDIENMKVDFYVDKTDKTLKFTSDKKAYYNADDAKQELIIDKEYFIYCDSLSTDSIIYNGEIILPLDTFEWSDDESTSNIASVYVLNKNIEYQFIPNK
ncbi:hypothetical protein [Anaerorhabdus furcosa]|uniref:Lipoprotein n=1 Tax=Anaerorhabdus furcosa TaxID=118967 RepID=A0A1T4PWI9_9FIRM|nr:hypothetical protein [Anaerorhabdus furcosa]SJZ95677.1 hypothetical protein SAMN02745191_2201 [Anaerorhabdus furcosa]